MELQVIRYSSNQESTLGLLLINGQFACYTLEDEARSVKVFGETRIPAHRYPVKLRTEGELHERYAERFPDLHKGMLHIRHVPDFQYVLIHIGNKDDDTAGCLLVGDGANNNQVTEGFIAQSTAAYERIYPPIAHAIEGGEEVWIEYFDRIPTAAPEPPEAPSPLVVRPGRVNTPQLNFRTRPGTTTTRAGILTQGTPVDIVEEVSGWYKVQLEGWVAGDYVTG